MHATLRSINDTKVAEELNNLCVDNIKLYPADFTDTFTNIPHNVIVSKIKHIISLCFKNADKNLVLATATKCFVHIRH